MRLVDELLRSNRPLGSTLSPTRKYWQIYDTIIRYHDGIFVVGKIREHLRDIQDESGHLYR